MLAVIIAFVHTGHLRIYSYRVSNASDGGQNLQLLFCAKVHSKLYLRLNEASAV